MGMESTSLSRTLKRLEDQGLIYRRKDDFDGRMVRIFLTDEGNKLRKLAKETILGFNNEVRSHIDPKKLETFFEVMDIIGSILERQKNLRAA